MSRRAVRAPARRHVPVPLLALAAAVMAFAVLLAVSPSARDRADAFLLVFRAGRRDSLSMVEVRLPQVPGIDPAALAGAVTVTMPAGQEVGRPHDAQDRLDFKVRSLHRSRAPRIHVFINDTATLTINRTVLQQALAPLAGPGLRLPPELDTPVEALIPAAVQFVWDEPEGPLTLWLTRNPKLYTTSGPTWEELRARLIQLLTLLDPQAAAQLQSVRDWDTTVVIPVPPGATARRVRADGTDNALLIEQDGRATLTWQRGGVVYVLDGHMPGQALVSLANTLD